VAKSLLLSKERTYSRKFKEAILARRIDKRFSKDEILEIYLNQSYFGYGSYGIESASRNYFQKNVWELTLPEMALLAGLPKSPSAYDPTRNPERSKERRNLVLERMAEEGFITAGERAEATASSLDLNPKKKDPLDPAAYFAEEVRRYLYEKYGEEVLYSGGMQVYTTMDSTLQVIARDAVREGLENLDKRQGFQPMRSQALPAKFRGKRAILSRPWS
jgi:penicillin-binding protein 1A